MSDEKQTRRPILDPLLLTLKSRRVLIAFVTLVVGALVMAVPELEAVRTEMLTLLITLALALIGGYSIEDAARAARDTSGKLSPDLGEAIKELMDEWLLETAAAHRSEEAHTDGTGG